MRVPRVAVICDLLEEGWPSMDLVAEMLLKHLHSDHSESVKASGLRPAMRLRFARGQRAAANPTGGHALSGFRDGNSGNGGASAVAFNADRLLNRFWDYPRYLRGRKGEFDLFHIVDHSYSQLVHELPPGRAIVTCHDLDTFRCLLEPARERRGTAFRAMARRILTGLRRAARVVCVTAATRDELVAQGWIPPECISVIHNGVHPACSPEPDPAADREAARLLGPARDVIDIVHVGSTIARKRIDVLLHLFASLSKEFPGARLIRVGGPFTAPQMRLMEQLKLSDSVIGLPFLDRATLAAVYRRAALLLQPSESEGFGLPVVEAMACGTPVIASDLTTLREAGGEAARYCPVADIEGWGEAVIGSLRSRVNDPDGWAARRAASLAQAAKFSWAEHARKMVAIYKEVLQRSLHSR